MLPGNDTILDKNVADAAEQLILKKGKANEKLDSNDTHSLMTAIVGQKDGETYAVRNYIDIVPGGKVRMGIKDTREKIAIWKGLILI